MQLRETGADGEIQMLTAVDVAEALCLSLRTVRAMIEDGRLASAKIGQRVRIPRSEVIRLVAENLRPATKS